MKANGHFWMFLLVALVGCVGCLTYTLRFAVVVQIKDIPKDTQELREIRAAAVGKWGKERLEISILPAASPIEIVFESASEEGISEELLSKVTVRSSQGALTSVDNARIREGRAIWSSSLEDCTIEIPPHSHLISATVIRPGIKNTTVRLNPDSESGFRIDSSSGRRALFFRTRIQPQELFLATGARSNHVKLESLQVTLGSLSIFSMTHAGRVKDFKTRISADMISSVKAKAVASLAKLLGRAIAFLVALLLMGLPIANLFSKYLTAQESATLGFISALSIVLCTTVTLGLLGCPVGMTAKTTWMSALFFSVTWSLYSFFKARRRARDVLGLLSRATRGLTPLTLISLICSIACLLPAMIYPDTFFGHNYTDTYWYVNIASYLWDHSPIQFSAELWKTQRLGDICSLVLARALLGCTTLAAYPSLAAAFVLALPWPIYCICLRISKNVDLSLSSAIIAGTSAATFALYTQCYLAQYLMTHFLVYGIFMGLITLNYQDSMEKSRKLALCAIFAAVLGAGFTLYPYVQVIPLAYVAVILLRGSNDWRSAFKMPATIALLTLLWSNLSLQTVLHVGGNSQYAEALNSIAKHHVFPFFDSLDVFSRSLGLKDWVMNSQFSYEILSTFHLTHLSLYGSLISSANLLISWVGLIIFIMWGIFIAKQLARREIEALLGITLLSIGILSAVFFYTRQTYFFGKIFFSLGSLLSCFPLLLARGRKFFWMFLGTCYVLVNFSVLAIDAAPLYLGPRSSLTSKVRSHFGVLDSDLLSISELIKQVKGITRRTASSSNVAIIGRWDALKGTDKDRVLIWYLKEGFSDSQILFTEAINPGGAFLHDYISSVKLKSLEEMLLQGRIYLVLICPGYFAPPGMAGILTLVSENSWGNLYVPNSALLPGGPFYAPTSADIKQKIQL